MYSLIFFIMALYYVNKKSQSDGYHEVHTSLCSKLPDSENRIYLGDFNSCSEAIKKAKNYYSLVDGCYLCSYACHTR